MESLISRDSKLEPAGHWGSWSYAHPHWMEHELLDSAYPIAVLGRRHVLLNSNLATGIVIYPM